MDSTGNDNSNLQQGSVPTAEEKANGRSGDVQMQDQMGAWTNTSNNAENKPGLYQEQQRGRRDDNHSGNHKFRHQQQDDRSYQIILGTKLDRIGRDKKTVDKMDMPGVNLAIFDSYDKT